MPETPSGIDTMRARMERASRRPPPSRRASGPPATQSSAPAAPSREPAISAEGAQPPPGTTPARPSPAPRRRRAQVSGPRVSADAPVVNLAIRVRRPLDDRLADIIHALRGAGVRTSKVELIELLLWELPETDAASEELIERLRAFRGRAPRMGGELPGGS